MEKYNRYDSELKINPKKGELKAKVNFKYIVKEKEKNIELYIHNNMKIKSIKGDLIKKYFSKEEIDNWSPFIGESKKIEIEFERELTKGEEVNIEFEYEGIINQVGDGGINRINDEWVELGVYSPWFPLTEDFQKAWFKTNIELLTEDYEVVSSNDVYKENDKWIIEQKQPFIDCSFLISKKFKTNKITKSFKDCHVSLYYIDEEHKEVADELSDKIGGILNLFGSRFGDIEKQNHSIVIVPRDNSESGGGYNRPGLVVLPDLNNRESSNHKKYGSDDLFGFKYLAHELGHLWWSKADVRTWEDWLNESFAEYSCLLSIKELIGEEDYVEKIKLYEELSIGLPAIYQLKRDDEEAFDVLYTKGPYLLHKLNEKIGEEKFFELLNKLHINKVSKTKDMLNLLGNISGEDVKIEFENMLKN